MELKFLKWLAVLAASTMLYGSTNSEVADCCPPPTPPKPCCEPKPCPPKPCCVPAKIIPNPPCNVCQDPCCPPMQVYNRNVNPPGHCLNMCANDMYVTGAFLWWIPDEADFSLGFNQSTPVVPPVAGTPGTAANGNVLRFGFNWDPGFRVGLGWQSHTFEGWDAYLSWTWYKNTTTQNATATVAPTATGTTGIVPYWGSFNPSLTGISSLYGNMNAKWKLLYNMIDLELGREFFVSCSLSLRPYVSVEGGWINRKWNVSYSNGFDSEFPATATPSDSYSAKSKYWGIGPRAGLSGNWWLGSGFKFFGNLGGSILSGKVSKNSASHTHSTSTTTGVFTDQSSYNEGSFYRSVPHLQAVVGAGWDTCFCCEKYRFIFTAGWEVNQYWNVPMMLYNDTTSSAFVSPAVAGFATNFNRVNRSNNLSVSGLTAEVRFEF